ncbi:MAG: tetratricopeptide repeat protein [Candidatus Latescibacteria bacterium]|nr:tetratricopeptide repeat protein [Candidatus Latescibacterota bacterium]NIM22589.1 tetratricopeptide repeat protein [Candidatus Latescibacterota bacterium]NIM64878.1 tetratricopeptide repeat protein [Candidatus Latescibacterota bacterium]NIO01393.1 tetratricopeptide repeat protein [Candidatus Latescibacterota bacterium]NIO27903.1 tetratricopeptide repeat protein [Candidatus Latescibacterota bacterium]
MKIRLAHIAWLMLLAIVVVSGCKSVATTSAILRNQEGNYDLAIGYAKQALQENPRDAEAYFQLGISYSNLDSVALAYENFQKSVELDPSDKRKELAENNIKHNYSKHYNSGQAAFQDKEYNAAAEEFIAATQADPRQSVAYYNLGVAYSRLAAEDSTYHERSIEALEQCLEKSTPDQSHYIDALGLVGRELAEVGRVEEAVSRFNRLVEEDPANYDVIERLGVQRFNNQDWKAANMFLKMAADARIKIGAEDFKLYYDLGRVNYFMREEDPEALNRAIYYYEKALELETEDAQTMMNLIIAYMAKEDWSSGIAWGEKYINIWPDDERGWRLLSMSYSKIGDKEKARQCAEKYAEIMAKKEQGQ